MIPDLWSKIYGFFTRPYVRQGIQIILLLAVAGLLWIGRVSFLFPGPAIAVTLLTLATLIILKSNRDLSAQRAQLEANNSRLAQTISSLRAKNRDLLQQLETRSRQRDEEAAGSRPKQPRLLGLELLVERWRTFSPRQSDSVILYEQLAIAQSVAQQQYPAVGELRFLSFFSGFKIKGGAFLIQPGQQLPLVLKFDSLRNINAETDRYRDCVAGQLGLVPGEPIIPAQRSGRIEGEAWGAITYNLIGADPAETGRLRTFAEYYANQDDPALIEGALEKIFAALRPWWQNPPGSSRCLPYRRNNLYGEYDRLIRNQIGIQQGMVETGHRLQVESLRTIGEEQDYLTLNDRLRLRNPLHWLKIVFQSRRLGSWAEQPGLRRDSIVHGDLHAGNILISHDNTERLRAWIIDFPHAHVGPTVQDLARLEADLKFGLWSGGSLAEHNIDRLYQFEIALLSAAKQPEPSLIDLVPARFPDTVSADPIMQRTWDVVSLIRKEARNYMNGFDARPYYLALLHATLPSLYYRNRDPWQKIYSFISAALLCERLDHPGSND